MERNYGSLVRHELGSSYSALDGVPFKIGRNFRKPEEITSLQLTTTNGPTVLSEEYSFETEEAVLAWAKARDAALKKAAEEQAEQKKLAQEKADQVAKQAALAVVTDGHLSSKNEPGDISVYDIPSVVSVADSVKQDSTSVKPPLPPKVGDMSAIKSINESSGVLTPVPAKRTVLPGKAAADKLLEPSVKIDSQLDLALFEAEADPFDNLELQTLNDMEELRVLLNSTPVTTDSSTLATQSNSSQCKESRIIVSGSANNTNGATSQTIPSDNDSTKDNVHNLLEKGDTSLKQEFSLVFKEGDYVELVKKEDTAPDQPLDISYGNTIFQSPNGPDTNTCIPENTTSTAFNSQIYKPVLPPIGNIAKTTSHSLSQLPSEADTNSTSINGSSTSYNTNTTSVSKPGFKPNRPAPPPPVSTKPILRHRSNLPTTDNQMPDAMSASSGPSLAMYLGDSTQSEKPKANNAYSRHCISTSDLQSVSSPMRSESPRRNSAASPQPWNRHVPLPPTVSGYKPSCLPQQKSQGLSDPYSSLSKEEQAFVDMLTGMGFLRARVSRAVQKFGTQEKEVLDHLVAVDHLGEKSYAPIMIETALFTFKNDILKAEKFLQLYTQFEELGFQHDKIHEALVSTDLQHEKALDILTA